jgi:HlyD family secretion protein
MQGNRAELWLISDGRATRRQVQLGLRGLTQTEVTAGLRVGDWILADGQAAVAQGDRVRVVSSSLSVGAAETATRKELPAKLD